MKEFKSFYKQVGGNEGNKCYYPIRLDTYGRGCQHDCAYCYAKSLLSFRGMWDSQEPAMPSMGKIRARIKRIPAGTIVRLGGMTDCFQPIEKKHRITYQTIQALNEQGVGYLIVTKSASVADPEYLKIYDPALAHIQVTVTSTDDRTAAMYEHASPPSHRVKAIHKLSELGIDTAIRLSPLMEEYIDFDALNSWGMEKAVVEFLRVNSWIKKWFDIDYSKYTLRQSGYWHLPLEEKVRIVNKIKIPVVTVCEDFTEHYVYWRDNFNPARSDCCNLRRLF